MVNKELIGQRSQPTRIKIEDDAVRRFTEAIGSTFTGQVPPTFVITLRAAAITGLPKAGLIHGSQKFVYHQPLAIGDSIAYTSRIKDIYERRGKLGRMSFVVLETVGVNPAGEPVFTSISTLIAPEQGGGPA